MSDWKLERFAVTRISDLQTTDRFGWVQIKVSFQTGDDDPREGIQIDVPVRYQRSWTIEQIREAAYAEARSLLARTSGMFAQHSLAEFQQLDDAIEAQHAAELAAIRRPLEFPDAD